ncbi:hypothetical protein [uncultured Algibacter sp.]|uniref:hypothetical protein n=1 Tax=uncultured Algibacter sp. TaxID=298659 RepID=UPI0026142CE6|nr:hypothetical protein [uncultured Algibacter sp.]
MKCKLLIPVLVLIMTFSSITSCSSGCDNSRPRAKITNNGTDKASVQIKTSNGNTENINNIETGTVSDWVYYDAGQIEYTVEIQGEANPIEINVNMSTCFEYNIIIDDQNNVTSVPTERE